MSAIDRHGGASWARADVEVPTGNAKNLNVRVTQWLDDHDGALGGSLTLDTGIGIRTDVRIADDLPEQLEALAAAIREGRAALLATRTADGSGS